jgi:hypothetical protein|tara:strand:+ start:236 stop:442 length:207 start_codon:yes stop_codon:yes gene_type:complete
LDDTAKRVDTDDCDDDSNRALELFAGASSSAIVCDFSGYSYLRLQIVDLGKPFDLFFASLIQQGEVDD